MDVGEKSMEDQHLVMHYDVDVGDMKKEDLSAVLDPAIDDF